MLLQLLAAGLGKACLQALVLQVLLDLLKLLPADSPLLQLADSPCPLRQLYLHHKASTHMQLRERRKGGGGGGRGWWVVGGKRELEGTRTASKGGREIVCSVDSQKGVGEEVKA